MKPAIRALFVAPVAAFILTACHSSKNSDNSFLMLFLKTSLIGKTIFETSLAYRPGGSDSSSFNSVARADTICGSDPAHPSSGIFLALLVDDTNRIASTGANTGTGQVNWVLTPNTSYANTAGVTLFTTDANGLFVFGTLNASLGGTGATPWTGLNTDWTRSANTCSNWTLSAGNGTVGADNKTTVGFISNTTQSCGNTEPLLCVMQ